MLVLQRKRQIDDEDETNTAGRPASSRGHFGAGSTSNTCFLDVFVLDGRASNDKDVEQIKVGGVPQARANPVHFRL